jgi:hypothetical protein
VSNFDVTSVPSGTYRFFLLAVPAGTQAADLFQDYYVWSTALNLVRASDIAHRAIAALGTDDAAAAAIFLAADKGYSIEQIISAANAGKLSFFGEVGGDSTRAQSNRVDASKAGTVASRHCSDLDLTNGFDKQRCANRIEVMLRGLLERNDMDALRTTITAMLFVVGYTPEQMAEAVENPCCDYGGAGLRIRCCYDDAFPSECGQVFCRDLSPANVPTNKLIDSIAKLCPIYDESEKVTKARDAICTPPCRDADGDGFYHRVGCGNDGGLDCDDLRASSNPGQLEICGDGVDNNCDGLVDQSDPQCNTAETCPDPAFPSPCGPYCYAAGTLCCDGGGNACDAGEICAATGCCSGGELPCGAGCMPAEATCCGSTACGSGTECCGNGCMPAGNVCCAPVGHCPKGCTCNFATSSCDCPS